MLRTIDIIMIGCLLGGVAFTYKIKRDSELAMERVAELERQIMTEQDLIDVLKADWNLLASPDRIQALVERYREQLELKQTEPGQIGRIDEIPQRKLVLPGDGGTGIADLIGADGSITTGSVVTEEDGQGGEAIE